MLPVRTPLAAEQRPLPAPVLDVLLPSVTSATPARPARRRHLHKQPRRRPPWTRAQDDQCHPLLFFLLLPRYHPPPSPLSQTLALVFSSWAIMSSHTSFTGIWRIRLLDLQLEVLFWSLRWMTSWINRFAFVLQWYFVLLHVVPHWIKVFPFEEVFLLSLWNGEVTWVWAWSHSVGNPMCHV
jgi:hypothetical protein